VLLGGEAPLSDSQQDNIGSRGCPLQRLGGFHLKGIDSPMVLNELVIPDHEGRIETFPEPRTKGRVSS